MEEDGFKIVKSRRKNRSNNSTSSEDIITWTPAETIKKTNVAVAALSSDYDVNKFLDKLVGVAQAHKTIAAPSVIVCYGLGSVTHSRIAQIQLGLLSVVKQTLNIDTEAYDPIFTAEDRQVLEHFGCSIIDRDEKARRRADTRSVLFYMPHCHSALYENVVKTNLDSNTLTNCILLGNSFSQMVNVEKPRLIRAIHLVRPYWREIPFPSLCSVRDDAFNDTNLTLFPSVPSNLLANWDSDSQ